MPVETADIAGLRETMERLAAARGAAGPGDLQELAAVHGWLGEVGGSAAAAAAAPAADAAVAAAGLVERLILGEAADPAEALEVVNRTVAALQATLCDGRAAEYPVQLGLGDGGAPPLPDGLRHPGHLPAHVEPAIFGEFLARQDSTLEEIEAQALALERGAGAEAAARLRRTVHTLKGEAALLGLHDVERLCHAIEDALQGPDPARLAEPLLQARDWLAQAVAASLGRADFPGPSQPLVDRFRGGGDAVAADSPPAGAATGAAPLTGDPTLLGEFVSEAREHLEAAESHLLTLEKQPRDDDALNAVFRAFHTIKGVAGFLGLEEIGRLAHEAENLLDRARKGRLLLAGAAVEVTFQSVDLMKRLIEALAAALAAGGMLAPEPQLPALLARLRAAQEGSDGAAAPATAAAAATVADAPAAPVPAAARPPAAAPAPSAAPRVGGSGGAAVREAVKVDSDRLDRLVDTIGELVIAESMVSQSLQHATVADGALARQLGLLDKITRQLQEMATSLRMVPVRSTFQKMARLARDLSVKAGKPVEFVTAGEDTELDKTVVDRIGDPLVHMVRNAVDHGLEASVEERRRAGKPDKGRVELRAFHRGGSIWLEIEDDGRGLDREAILAKARERGLLRDGETPADSQVYDLIFAPGFSTAKKITEVSGRGVGMDVVKRSIQALRGAVEIRTVPGQGTTFAIRLPLTMAIIDGLIVRIGAERYIVPTLSVVRTVQPGPRDVKTVMRRGELLAVEGGLLPLFRLARLYGVANAQDDAAQALAVVIESEGRQAALLVDELLGQQQIVIKSIGKGMPAMPGVAGGAILPDGRVGLILDPAGLVRLAQGGGAGAVARE